MNSIHDLDEAIDRWFEEDIRDGDHTTLSTITFDASGSAELLVKEEGIIAGVDVAQRIFKRFDPESFFPRKDSDTDPVSYRWILRIQREL